MRMVGIRGVIWILNYPLDTLCFMWSLYKGDNKGEQMRRRSLLLPRIWNIINWIFLIFDNTEKLVKLKLHIWFKIIKQ